MQEVARLSKDLTVTVGDDAWDLLIGVVLEPIGQVNDVLMWLENIATLVAAFLDLFRNKDDLVKECSYAINYNHIYWVNRFFPNGRVGWEEVVASIWFGQSVKSPRLDNILPLE